MKKFSMLISILTVVAFLAVIFPVYANAAPVMRTNPDLKVFHGKWTSVRLESPQTLKIRCDVETNYCKMDMVTEISTSCTNNAGGVPTGRYFEGESQVEVINYSITIPAISYCMTKPPSDFYYGPPITFTYHLADDTLTDGWGVTWYRK
jgi:hypothetical protein